MNKTFFFLAFLLSASLHSLAQKPNIIFVLVDDLGYGDVGTFFQNQRMHKGDRSQPWQITPELDKMASSGAILTQQYCNAPVCAPSRASLLSGLNQGNANVRDNQFDKALEDNHTMATVLKQAGYVTSAVGKWGLQGTNENDKPNWPAHPLKRGFDAYYGYMRHSDGHEHYPLEGIYRGKKEVYHNYDEVSAGLAKCYTTDLWTAWAKKWIVDHKKGKNADKPFFMYLAYDAPHAVLELPTQAYPKGGGLNGGVQWQGQPGKMINTASGTVDSYVYPEYDTATYDHDDNPATAEVPWPDTYKRYASAVRRLDDAVGDVRQLLKDLHINENTIVVFSSDNGPSIESYLPKGYVPNHPTFFGSYGPFDGIKRDCWEGGLRMPVLVNWDGHIEPGKVIATPGMLSDWLPTFVKAAGLPVPARMNGVSLLPTLTGKGAQEKSNIYVEYFEGGRTPDFKEFEASRRGRLRRQMQMVREGDYVGVRYNIVNADDDFEIYDGVNDPKQTNNLAAKPEFKELQKRFKAKALQSRRVNASAPRPYDSTPVPAVAIEKKLKKGLNWEFYPGTFPWVSQIERRKAAKKGKAKKATGAEASAPGMIVYRGYVQIPETGEYIFDFKASGKAVVKMHEANLFDADFGYTESVPLRESAILEKGLHPVTIYYLREGNGNPGMSFDFQRNKNQISTHKMEYRREKER